MSDQGESLARVSVPEMDALLGKPFPVLDQGFIRVVDYMGNDGAIVQAARVSYGKGTKQLRDDAGLIRYLMRHGHTSPLEMCSIKLHVRVPMDCWRHWIRHRTAKVNEYSTRFSEAIDAMQVTPPDAWRRQSQTNKQGSAGLVTEYPPGYEEASMSPGEYLSARELEIHRLAREVYQERLKFGVAREQARKDLPLSSYTEAYWTIDLHNLLHFLKLRMDIHAQAEIRAYAHVIGQEIVKRWVPLTWQAFQEYVLGAVTFSQTEISILWRWFDRYMENEDLWAYLQEIGFVTPTGKPSRELVEFDQKLSRIAPRMKGILDQLFPYFSEASHG